MKALIWSWLVVSATAGAQTGFTPIFNGRGLEGWSGHESSGLHVTARCEPRPGCGSIFCVAQGSNFLVVTPGAFKQGAALKNRR
jgi:hypothetical protein